MSNKVHNQVKSSEIPKSIYVRHALMFIFSDIFSNYVREFEKELSKYGIQFTHELKYHFNNYLRSVLFAKKEADRFLEIVINHSADSTVDNIFKDSDSFNDLIKLILDRVVGESSDGDVFRDIYSYVFHKFESSGMFPELAENPWGDEVDTSVKCCDAVKACPLARSSITTRNGERYAHKFCYGSFEECCRRKIRLSKGVKFVPDDLLPDGDYLKVGESVFSL